MFTSVLACSK